MRVLPQGSSKGACKESKCLTLVPRTCMRKVVPVNERCILREAGMSPSSSIFSFPWSTSHQLEGPRSSSEHPLSLSLCSGSWQSPHGGTATQRPGLSLLLSVGMGCDQQLLGAGRYKYGSRPDVGHLRPVCTSLEPCWTVWQGAGLSPLHFTVAPAFSRAWLCLHQCCQQESHFFLMVQVTQGTCWVQQLIGMCSLLLLLLLREGSWFKEDEGPVSSA